MAKEKGMLPYKIISAKKGLVPILLSIPHCGTEFPVDLKDQFKPELTHAPDDTDWFVDRLYDFAKTKGIVTISATYSRWIIDLNRDPQSKPLYNDGRVITGLCPTTNFLGKSIYNDGRNEVNSIDLNTRLEKYYWPYHNKVQELLSELKYKFGRVLLWDCHSIRQFVPSIHKEKFPDLILGDVDASSASSALIEITTKNLQTSNYTFGHNYPFKGGFITRHFGKPNEGQHALQLEMTKVNYMDDAELKYDETRANTIRRLLNKNFDELINYLMQ